LFTFGKYLTRYISANLSHRASNSAIGGAFAVELLVATDGGYFGGDIGIMNLALFSALGVTDIHAMNALKVVLVTVIRRPSARRFHYRSLCAKSSAGIPARARDCHRIRHDHVLFCKELRVTRFLRSTTSPGQVRMRLSKPCPT
jgi:hypothetical protein